MGGSHTFFGRQQPAQSLNQTAMLDIVTKLRHHRQHQSLPKTTDIALAFLEIDFIQGVLQKSNPVVRPQLAQKWSHLIRGVPCGVWKSLQAQAFSSFEQSDIGIHANPIQFGLEIGRTRDIEISNGAAMFYQSVNTSFLHEISKHRWIAQAAAQIDQELSNAMCSVTNFSNSGYLYETVVQSASGEKVLPCYGCFRGPHATVSEGALYESLSVTLGVGSQAVVVSVGSGRSLFPGTLAFLEAFSPFCAKLGLPHWNASEGKARAQLLHDLLNDRFFVHIFVPYSPELQDPKIANLRSHLATHVDFSLDSNGLRATPANNARQTVKIFGKQPWFSALAEGVRAPTSQGASLRETFANLWNFACQGVKPRGFPKTKALLQALGEPKAQTDQKPNQTQKQSACLGVQRLGLWRARRGEATAASLSETKLLTTAQRLRSEGLHILKSRGLPLDLLPDFAFVKNDSAPEIAYAAYNNSASLNPKILERPWSHARDAIAWVLAHVLAAHYEKGTGEINSQITAHAAWKLACKRLSLRPELSARTGHSLSQVPAEAWLERECLDDDERRFLEKIDKLLNLSSSSNEHEAALAMGRAQQLLGARRLDLRMATANGFESEDEKSIRPFVSLNLSLGVKKIDNTLSLIGSLLKAHYSVSTLWGQEYDPSTAESGVTLVIIGRKENVLLAEHVFDFLTQQAESQWQVARKQGRLKVSMRLSFQYGLIQGFREKLDAARRQTDSKGQGEYSEGALMRLDEIDLDAHLKELFPDSTTTSQVRIKLDAKVTEAGKEQGTRLSIHAPVSGTSGTSAGTLLLR